MTSTMCEMASGSRTALVHEEQGDSTASSSNAAPILRLRLGATGGGPRVAWAADVVDNEHLERKKSKCCCVYVKQRQWNESSSENESDTECDHCRGHVELKKSKKPHSSDTDHSSDDDEIVAKKNAGRKKKFGHGDRKNECDGDVAASENGNENNQ